MLRKILLLVLISTLLASAGCIRQKRGDVFDTIVNKIGTMGTPEKKIDIELDEKDYFEYAMDLFEQGDFMTAQHKFALFNKKFQNSKSVPDSVFFQGECFFNSKVYLQASRYYQSVIDKYPYSTYAPQAALKNGISMFLIGKKRKATRIFSNIEKLYADTVYSEAAFLALKGKINEAEKVASGVEIEPEVRVKVTTRVINSKIASPNFTGKTSKCVSRYPNRYLVVIANSAYKHYGNLSYVKNDEKVLRQLGNCYLGVPEKNILIYRNTTFLELKRIFSHLNSIVRHKDSTLFMYYTGHGVEDKYGSPYIVPVDASLKSEIDLKDGAVPLTYVQSKLASLKTGKKIFVWDACRTEVPWKLITVTRSSTDISDSDSTYIFATSSGKTSNISKNKSVSAFLDSLMELAQAGTSNFDFDSSGYVELNEIKESIEFRLKTVTTDQQQKLEIQGSQDVGIFPVR